MSRSKWTVATKVTAGDKVQLLDGETGGKVWRSIQHVDAPETGPLIWIIDDDSVLAMPHDAELWVIPAVAS